LLRQYLQDRESRTWDYDWTTAIFLYGAQTYLRTSPDVGLVSKIDAAYDQLARQIPEVTTPDLAALSLPAQHWKSSTSTRAIVAATEKYFATEPLNEVGALDHVGPRHWIGRFYPSSVWADSMIMYVLNGYGLAQKSGHTTRAEFFLAQAELLHRLLLDPTTGLYKHAYFVSAGTKVPNKFHWARGNLWMSLGQLELLETLPATHPGHTKLRDQWTAHLKAVLSHYVPGKGLKTLLDDPSKANYFEASATALLAFVLLKGERIGFLTAEEKNLSTDVVRTAQNFLAVHKDQVTLRDISGPTTAFKWHWYYTHVVGKVTNESYGVGSFLLLCSELGHDRRR
jgi:rhamnogalacturonyl hydrolase YesR